MRPLLNEAKASSLSYCDLSPWMEVALYSSRYKKSSSASAPRFVSTNTNVRESGPTKDLISCKCYYRAYIFMLR